ncbi:hypothetical protein ACIP98_12045 [Streptomyces sp. NPDC088354]|uniref:hypothetical protein n=1 Tax=unclassified Streptomyces TaxID=2593676 RepID=UPI0029A6EB72|nr:hypothetical protein [Streptomyces sp. MI02-7b]MDX3071679.1 hypothetical protein [Streptomyces sp. MI02-7b]
MRKGIAAAGCAAFIATTAAACGTAGNLSAGAKVQQALDRLGEQKAATLSVGFGGSEQQIWSALKGADGFTRADAKLLAGLDVSLSMSATTPLKDLKSDKDNASVALRVSLGQGKDLLEIRSLAGKQAYFRADVRQFLSLAGDLGAKQDDADLREFRQMLDAADGLPSSFKSVKDALGGKWVSVDPKAFEEFSKSMAEGSQGGSPLPDPSALDAKTQERITKALREALEHNAKFTDAGTKDGADHVTVTLAAGKTADALADALEPLADQLPDGFSAADLKQVPDKDVSVDVAVKDGTLSGISLDLDQFDTGDEIHGALPLTVGFAPDARPVSAPAGATPLDPQDIMGAVMQLMAGGTDA